jgi:predicted RNA-binding Zn-ribbon protein involved in translation (DUF1610 family)
MDGVMSPERPDRRRRDPVRVRFLITLHRALAAPAAPTGWRTRKSEAWLPARTIGKNGQGSAGVHMLYEGAIMAIKRPTKGKGTPSHKPVATAPLRHVDVRAPQQMVSGEEYVGWLCKNRVCGLVIATAATALGGKTMTDFDDQLTAIKCPHCGNEDLYRWSARSKQNYTPKSGSS